MPKKTQTDIIIVPIDPVTFQPDKKSTFYSVWQFFDDDTKVHSYCNGKQGLGASADFEAQHPRGPDGEFIKGSGSTDVEADKRANKANWRDDHRNDKHAEIKERFKLPPRKLTSKLHGPSWLSRLKKETQYGGRNEVFYIPHDRKRPWEPQISVRGSAWKTKKGAQIVRATQLAVESFPKEIQEKIGEIKLVGRVQKGDFAGDWRLSYGLHSIISTYDEDGRYTSMEGMSSLTISISELEELPFDWKHFHGDTGISASQGAQSVVFHEVHHSIWKQKFVTDEMKKEWGDKVLELSKDGNFISSYAKSYHDTYSLQQEIVDTVEERIKNGDSPNKKGLKLLQEHKDKATRNLRLFKEESFTEMGSLASGYAVRERDETAFKTLLPIYEKSIPEETRKGIGVGAAGSEEEEEAGAKIAAIIATLYPQMNKDQQTQAKLLISRITKRPDKQVLRDIAKFLARFGASNPAISKKIEALFKNINKQPIAVAVEQSPKTPEKTQEKADEKLDGFVTKMMAFLTASGLIISAKESRKIRLKEAKSGKEGIPKSGDKEIPTTAGGIPKRKKQQEIIAILTTKHDPRVDDVCIPFHGLPFKLGDPLRPKLPLHYGCRCTWIDKETGEDLGQL